MYISSEMLDRLKLWKQSTQFSESADVPPVVIYALRYTFLTRLGESGYDVWTLARIAGHSSIKMSERYVHTLEATLSSRR